MNFLHARDEVIVRLDMGPSIAAQTSAFTFERSDGQRRRVLSRK